MFEFRGDFQVRGGQYSRYATYVTLSSDRRDLARVVDSAMRSAAYEGSAQLRTFTVCRRAPGPQLLPDCACMGQTLGTRLHVIHYITGCSAAACLEESLYNPRISAASALQPPSTYSYLARFWSDGCGEF